MSAATPPKNQQTRENLAGTDSTKSGRVIYKENVKKIYKKSLEQLEVVMMGVRLNLWRMKRRAIGLLLTKEQGSFAFSPLLG